MPKLQDRVAQMSVACPLFCCRWKFPLLSTVMRRGWAGRRVGREQNEHVVFRKHLRVDPSGLYVPLVFAPFGGGLISF